MNHKVFRSVFVLTVTLALATVMVKIKDAPEVPAGRAAKAAAPDPVERIKASYRVREEKAERGMDYAAANYKATVTEEGVSFGGLPEAGSLYASREFTVELGTPRIQQGEVELECQGGKFVRPARGVAQIHRGAVIEEYIFENRRIEQLFHFPVAIGTGALRVSIPVKTDLGGQVVVHTPSEATFRDFRFKEGGLEFQDKLGEMKLAVHGAIVKDADGRHLALAPRYERCELVLEVPPWFMARATYPVVIDPWFDLPTAVGFVGEHPSFARFGSGSGVAGSVFAWSDNSTGTPKIRVAGFDPEEIGTLVGFAGSLDGLGEGVNPSVVLGTTGGPVVAWQSNGSIFVQQFVIPTGGTSGGSWQPLPALGTFGGKNVRPSVAIMRGVVPGTVAFDINGNVTSSSPATFPDIPVVAWESEANGTIHCSAFYPGAPAIPANPTVPGSARAAVPSGWYPLGTANAANVGAGTTLSIALGSYPSVIVDSDNQPAIAFSSTATGNYEIIVARWIINIAPPAPPTTFPLFQVVATANSQSFDIFPSADFAFTNVSNTANPSQYPSLAVDDLNLTVAWQETESAAPPAPPGTTSQIYVTRSAGLGGFGLIGLNPGTPGGISDSPGLATTPVVDVGGGYIAVAWADTSNSKSSIYVRRLPLTNLGGQWEQIGFQGSAFPAAFVGEIAPIGGVSQSPYFAIQPAIGQDLNGDPSVIWADGSDAKFQIKGKKFFGNAPGEASGIGTVNPTFTVQVQQSSTDPALGITPVGIGQRTTGTSVWLFARVFTETVTPATSTLRLEIEIQPTGMPFTGTPNVPQTLFVAPDDPTNPTLGNLASIKFDGLPNFNYHWRARTVDQIGRRSPWVSPGEQAGVSFQVNGTAGAAPPPVVANPATPSKGSCGLTGLEAIALLGALSLLRRRAK
jgi:hypothetical protein